MLVRKPAQHDLRMGSKKAEVTFYEPRDCGHVRNKFPEADEKLIIRLGQAITRRRMYLKYRERHAMKLRQGLDPGSINQDSPDNISETVVTNIHHPGVDIDDQASASLFTETSYPFTLISGGNAKVPSPPPSSRDGAPFACPYCYFIITIKARSSSVLVSFFVLLIKPRDVS